MAGPASHRRRRRAGRSPPRRRTGSRDARSSAVTSRIVAACHQRLHGLGDRGPAPSPALDRRRRFFARAGLNRLARARRRPRPSRATSGRVRASWCISISSRLARILRPRPSHSWRSPADASPAPATSTSHVAVDDYSRVAYVEVLPDQTGRRPRSFLRRTMPLVCSPRCPVRRDATLLARLSLESSGRRGTSSAKRGGPGGHERTKWRALQDARLDGLRQSLPYIAPKSWPSLRAKHASGLDALPAAPPAPVSSARRKSRTLLRPSCVVVFFRASRVRKYVGTDQGVSTSSEVTPRSASAIPSGMNLGPVGRRSRRPIPVHEQHGRSPSGDRAARHGVLLREITYATLTGGEAATLIRRDAGAGAAAGRAVRALVRAARADFEPHAVHPRRGRARAPAASRRCSSTRPARARHTSALARARRTTRARCSRSATFAARSTC